MKTELKQSLYYLNIVKQIYNEVELANQLSEQQIQINYNVHSMNRYQIGWLELNLTT